MSIGRSFSISKTRRLSVSSPEVEDEILKELQVVETQTVVDAPMADLRLSADHVVELALLQCPTTTVTVFSDRAQVTRKVEIQVEPLAAKQSDQPDQPGGKKLKTTLVVISDLPQTCDDSSVRIAKKGGVGTVLEVSMENITKEILKDIPTSEDLTQEQVAQREREMIKEIDANLKRLNQELARVDKQRTWIQGYSTQQAHVASGIHLNPNDAMVFLSFMTGTHASLDQKRRSILKDISTQTAKRNELVVVKRVKSVYLLLGSAEGSLTFDLSYVVNQASWTPSYDLRVNSANLKSVELTYHGIITNNTGDSWKNVQLNLSTAQPHVGGSPPVLKICHVQFRSNYEPPMPMVSAARNMLDNPMYLKMDDDEAPGRSSHTIPKENATSTTFEIPRSSTIESDNQPHKVTISVIELVGSFSYTTIPKLAKAAFLRNKSVNPTNYPFLAGKANVFMDSTFVASSDIKTTNPGEEISLYLGSDASVVVEFKESLNRENKGVISKTLSTRYVHDISVKNTKTTPIRADIFDQLPKSQDSAIEINVIKPKLEDKEKEGAAFLNSFNNVRWLVTIPPGETWKVTFEYQVAHPSDKEVEFS